MTTRRAAAVAAALVFASGPALADPCGLEEAGRLVIAGYATGQTAIPDDQRPRLEAFADRLGASRQYCVFAQVDAQGSDEANEAVARQRAGSVRQFIAGRGIPADQIAIALQEEAFTLFGLLPADQNDDRRVVVTHN